MIIMDGGKGKIGNGGLSSLLNAFKIANLNVYNSNSIKLKEGRGKKLKARLIKWERERIGGRSGGQIIILSLYYY